MRNALLRAAWAGAASLAMLGNQAAPAQALSAEPGLALPWTSPAAALAQPAPLSADSDLGCLTTAIYYEAATEPAEGRRAVAEVVLNRLRHPAYPKTVCGVVYQGSQRRTGCQFTFTCDGSLARRPNQRLWREAEAIATEALAGTTPGLVGDALNYHADYVTPGWSRSLSRVTQIGAHIFYRPGSGAPPGSVPQPAARKANAGAPSALAVWGIPVARIAPNGAIVSTLPRQAARPVTTETASASTPPGS